MSDKVTEFFKRYNGQWLENFLFSSFGKYRYVHTLNQNGLDCYLSNLRSVSTSSSDDIDCVKFYVTSKFTSGTDCVNLFNMVDFKDSNMFIETFKKYLQLKAFL